MIGVIVTGHGNIATGIQSGMNLVFGNIENFSTIDFTEEITPEELENKIKEYNQAAKEKKIEIKAEFEQLKTAFKKSTDTFKKEITDETKK